MPARFSLDGLRRKRGLILIIAFVASALIETMVHAHSAPDVRWAGMLAVSMYLVFEASLLFARFLLKR